MTIGIEHWHVWQIGCLPCKSYSLFIVTCDEFYKKLIGTVAWAFVVKFSMEHRIEQGFCLSVAVEYT